MQFTGHKTQSVFKRSNIVGGSDLSDAAQKLEAFLTTEPKQEQPTGKVRQFKRRAAGSR
jgi:hypothetical protein